MTQPNGGPIDEVSAAVLAAAKTMYARGLVEGTAGNVSGRVDDGTVVVTPSSLSYEEMTLDDLVVVDLDGEVVSGTRSATSEKGVHLATLKAYPEVGAVVHCHALARVDVRGGPPAHPRGDRRVRRLHRRRRARGRLPAVGQRQALGRGRPPPRRPLGHVDGQPRPGDDRQVGRGRPSLGAGGRAQRPHHVGRAAVGRRRGAPRQADHATSPASTSSSGSRPGSPTEASSSVATGEVTGSERDQEPDELDQRRVRPHRDRPTAGHHPLGSPAARPHPAGRARGGARLHPPRRPGADGRQRSGLALAGRRRPRHPSRPRRPLPADGRPLPRPPTAIPAR